MIFDKLNLNYIHRWHYQQMHWQGLCSFKCIHQRGTFWPYLHSLFSDASFQNNTFLSHIFNVQVKYHVEHCKNTLYENELTLGNIVVADCVLERFMETKGACLQKVSFKLLGVGFIKKGILCQNEMWSIATAPSNHTLWSYSVCPPSDSLHFITILKPLFVPFHLPWNALKCLCIWISFIIFCSASFYQKKGCNH